MEELKTEELKTEELKTEELKTEELKTEEDMSATNKIEVVDEHISNEKKEKPSLQSTSSTTVVGNSDEPPEKSSAFEDRLVRQTFIRRVFLVLTLQFLVTSLIVAPLLLIESIRNTLAEDKSIFFYAILSFWIIYAFIVCSYGINRIWPMNYVMLILLTASMALVIASTCALINFTDILIGIACTAVLCFTLGSLASVSQFDFTVLTGILSTLLFTLLILIFLYVLVASKVVIWFILLFGITILIMYFIIDIEIIVSGKHRYVLTPQDYVAAATLLYVDIAFIFTFLIMMLIRRF